MVFKKKEKNRINLIFKDRKILSYKEFINNFSENFNSYFPVFIGLLATIFITLFIKDINIPPGEMFSFILTMTFTLIVLSSILVSIIATGILYLVIVLGFGSLVYLIQKITDKVILKFGTIKIIVFILILFLISIFLLLTSKTLTWIWMFGLLLWALGMSIGLHIISIYIGVPTKSKK